MAGTEGSEFIDETNPNKFRPSNYVFIGYNEPRGIPPGMVEKYRNLVLLKDHFDIFQGNPYANDIIATLKPKGIVVYGVATNVCVNFAVVGLLNRGYSVMVVKDAIKELPNLPVEPIYDDWRNRGALFVDADEIGGGL
jgi:nicotinamidase/pyrazinamidase